MGGEYHNLCKNEQKRADRSALSNKLHVVLPYLLWQARQSALPVLAILRKGALTGS